VHRSEEIVRDDEKGSRTPARPMGAMSDVTPIASKKRPEKIEPGKKHTIFCHPFSLERLFSALVGKTAICNSSR
jgi:hypothetical protein